VQKAHITSVKLFKARKDPPELLDFVDETFDQMPLFVAMGIIPG
jgi:hypothetical protein